MEFDIRQSGHRRTMLNRALKIKVTRLGTLSASITILLVLALLAVSPTRFRTISISKDTDIPSYRMPEPKDYDDEPQAPNWRYREKAVKEAFLHAYRAYEDNAFPADEVWPLSHQPRQKSV
jgi:mannosyl-oligosaccharide alpha-1,2-mannosidase